MNIKYCFTFIILLCLLHNIITSAQTVIHTETFDADSIMLPVGWSTTPPGGWGVETTAPSNGYPGSSGFANVVIRNTDSTNVYYLYSTDISTIGFNSVAVFWGARLTTNFSAFGSNIQSFDFSTDSGATWTNVPYTENSNTNLWSLDNDSMPIYLPANANNKANIRFRWVAEIVNASSGNYRIDDFVVSSNSTVTGDNETSLGNLYTAIYPNPASASINILTNKTGNKQIRMYDHIGTRMIEFFSQENKINIERKSLPDGFYLVELLDEKGVIISSSKLILN